MNAWCEVLGIAVPSLRRVRGHPDANAYALLLVALLERGVPMTLDEVATRFEEAGIALARDALRSLKRCRPGRPPVYRAGDLYEVDPYSDELDLWAFRLGLRPPKVPLIHAPPEVAPPLPRADQNLTPRELDDAFRDARVWNWSALRVAMAVLDAQGGRLAPRVLLDNLKGMGTHHGVRPESALHWRGGCVAVAESGDWVLDPSHPSVPAMRAAVRERVEVERRRRALRPDPAMVEVYRQRWEERRKAHAAELAGLRRALLYAAPITGTDGLPAAITLVDVAPRKATTWIGDEVGEVVAALAPFDLVAAMNVRPLLRSLGLDPRARRLADLSPPQRSFRRPRGRSVAITTEMLVRGSCGISRPFGDPAALRRMVERGDDSGVRRRMEAGARALQALYEYGRLHGAVRLRQGGLDERLSVPWVHRDEVKLYRLMRETAEETGWMEVVLGAAATGEDPWATAVLCRVVGRDRLADAAGWEVDQRDVQLARIPDEHLGKRDPRDPGVSVNSVSFGLRLLANTPPWDLSDDACPVILEALNNRAVPEADRTLAMRLAGNPVIMRDDLAHALLRVTEDPAEADSARATAVISLGPALEEGDMATLGGLDEAPPLSEITFRRVQDTLRRLYHDPDVPAQLRRSVLEASVRAHADWHEGAVRAAFHSGDPEWQLAALFCARYVPGFEDDVIRALRKGERTLMSEAIRVAGALGLWEAEGILSEIAETADEEIAEAALDALLQIEDQDGVDDMDFDDLDFDNLADFGDLDDLPGPPYTEGWGRGGAEKGGPTFH